MEFLKALDLFASDVLTRAELLALLGDVFAVVPNGGGPKLLDELKTLLVNRGTFEMTVRAGSG